MKASSVFLLSAAALAAPIPTFGDVVGGAAVAVTGGLLWAKYAPGSFATVMSSGAKAGTTVAEKAAGPALPGFWAKTSTNAKAFFAPKPVTPPPVTNLPPVV
jgi:hypothetical protein